MKLGVPSYTPTRADYERQIKSVYSALETIALGYDGMAVYMGVVNFLARLITMAEQDHAARIRLAEKTGREITAMIIKQVDHAL